MPPSRVRVAPCLPAPGHLVDVLLAVRVAGMSEASIADPRDHVRICLAQARSRASDAAGDPLAFVAELRGEAVAGPCEGCRRACRPAPMSSAIRSVNPASTSAGRSAPSRCKRRKGRGFRTHDDPTNRSASSSVIRTATSGSSRIWATSAAAERPCNFRACHSSYHLDGHAPEVPASRGLLWSLQRTLFALLFVV